MKNCPLFLIIFSLMLPFAIPEAGAAQGIEITSGAAITVTGNAIIVLDNQGFINNGTYTKGTETVTFSGNTAKTMSGSSNTDLYNLSITNSGGITTQLGLLTVNNLSVAAGAVFSIDPARQLTVNGSISNSGGNAGLVLKSDANGTASLLDDTGSVPGTVNRYFSGAAEDWHFLSTPVAAQPVSGDWLPAGTYGNGTGYDLYVWNEATNCWIFQLNTVSTVNWGTVHPGSNFEAGRGYLYSFQTANPTKSFAGNLHSGSVSCGLTFSSDSLELKGFNLVGNPYPSSIDWSAGSGWTRSALAPSGDGYDIWIWNPAAGNYGVYNSADGDGTGTNSVTRYIAPMQGFFVRAAGTGTLGMDNTVRVHNGASDWKNSTRDHNRISVVVASDENDKTDEVRLVFGCDENRPGAAKLFSPVPEAPSLYLEDGTRYHSVRYLSGTAENPSVPVLFRAGAGGLHTLRISFDPAQFETVMLEDRKEHYRQNMKIVSGYSFKASVTDDPFRFILHFGPDEQVTAGDLPAGIFHDGNNLNIDLTLVAHETEVTVCDVLGRTLYRQKLQGKTRHSLDMRSGAVMLIVYLQNPVGSLCRKVILPTCP
jgi:hypothetical protein